MASVPCGKFLDRLGEGCAFLARRADAGIAGLWRGGGTSPGARSTGESGKELSARDTSWELTLNGRLVVAEGDPMERLLDVLRERLGLTGTKEGCGEGECGACTVLLDGEPVLSCLVPLLQCRGRSIETVESLAEEDRRPFVEGLVESGGVQCGACTPGVAMTAWALRRRSPSPGAEEVREALAGNLCRCTGYEGILRALVEESGE